MDRRGASYIKATPTLLLTDRLKGKRVMFSDEIEGKPLMVTRKKHPLLGAPEQEFYTIIKTKTGITVGFPGVALVYEGETATFYGVQVDEKQVLADVVETEKMVFEIQD